MRSRTYWWVLCQSILSGYENIFRRIPFHFQNSLNRKHILGQIQTLYLRSFLPPTRPCYGQPFSQTKASHRLKTVQLIPQKNRSSCGTQGWKTVIDVCYSHKCFRITSRSILQGHTPECISRIAGATHPSKHLHGYAIHSGFRCHVGSWPP